SVMVFRHDIAKSLIGVIVRRCDDSQYRDITDSNLAGSTTFNTSRIRLGRIRRGVFSLYSMPTPSARS
ncbi:hypothetical protein N9M41_06565, partial [Rhodopirellula sp.]|nr:hypothetical protein [Rhodopirellula sp.]